jgi:hypothetical protein
MLQPSTETQYKPDSSLRAVSHRLIHGYLLQQTEHTASGQNKTLDVGVVTNKSFATLQFVSRNHIVQQDAPRSNQATAIHTRHTKHRNATHEAMPDTLTCALPQTRHVTNVDIHSNGYTSQKDITNWYAQTPHQSYTIRMNMDLRTLNMLLSRNQTFDTQAQPS